MGSWAYVLLIMGGIVLGCAAAVCAEQVHDPELKFSVTIPDGFVRDAQLAGARADFVHAFRKAEPGDIGIVIIIERMRGTIGRERLDMSNAPAGFTGRVFTVRWQEFDLNALEIPEEIDGIKMINYNVQVPLKKEAIQIRVVGGAEQKGELIQLTNGLLGSLQGESNWLRSAAPQALAQSSGYRWVLLAASVVGIVAGLVLLWRVRYGSRRGTVLGLAILIYVVSYRIEPGETREMRLLVGGMRMLGFLGILLGLFDLFSRPAAKRAVEEPPAG